MTKQQAGFFLWIALVLYCAPAFAQEELHINTYYPSPSGNYQDLRTDRMSAGSAYHNPATTALADGVLMVSGRLGVGTPVPLRPLEVKGDTSGQHTAILASSNNCGVALGGYKSGSNQYALGSIQSFCGAANAPLLLNGTAGLSANVRVGASASVAPAYQLDIECTSGTCGLGGKLDGSNTGVLYVEWCSGGSNCSAAGYYAHAVYRP
ncbi:MAG TPA: hypothetical protein VMD52_05370 [Patescibacteria group bacterium]|nr:hypothetical protein [Patescibacteria group bacterium]